MPEQIKEAQYKALEQMVVELGPQSVLYYIADICHQKAIKEKKWDGTWGQLGFRIDLQADGLMANLKEEE
jgi:hypothetical protein